MMVLMWVSDNFKNQEIFPQNSESEIKCKYPRWSHNLNT
jgi:hypothetical protein